MGIEKIVAGDAKNGKIGQKKTCRREHPATRFFSASLKKQQSDIGIFLLRHHLFHHAHRMGQGFFEVFIFFEVGEHAQF